MAYKNAYGFAQYTDPNYVPGGDLNLKLDVAWATREAAEGCELVIVHQTIRRVLGMVHTPKKIVIRAQDPRIDDVLKLNSKTNAAHRATFDAQAEQAATDKANRVIVKTLREAYAKLGLDL